MKRIVFVMVYLFAVAFVVQAQTDCEIKLKAANEYYNKGDYAKAAKMYMKIQTECSENYGGAAAKLIDCNRKLKEDEDFGRCTTLTTCNNYLKNYPDGRYIDRVQQIRDGIIKSSVNVAEDDKAYQDCVTKEDYLEYLKKHSYGRHIRQARAMLAQFEEDEDYENCISESECEAYLKTYPHGRYYSEVLAKKNVFEEERLRKEKEAAKTAYMNIREVDFANTHSSGTLIDAYGATLYISEIQYLTPRISYDGLLDDTKLITLFYKFIRPDGTLMYKSNSPSDYSYFNYISVQPGSNNLYELPAWGSDNDGYYVAGTYKFELWFEDSRIYQTSFEVVDLENALSHGHWRMALQKCCDYVSHSDENSSYKGLYYNYLRSGLGMYSYKVTSSYKGISYYIGDWIAGERNGVGILITPSGYTMSNCPDCEYFVGEVSSIYKSGSGTCYDKYGNLIYKGTFVNDRPAQSYPSSGEYDNYKFECIEYSWGDYYVGETYLGKPHGKGFYIWRSGDMWYGDWRFGDRNGYGISMLYQGPVSAGIWENDIEQ